MKNTKEKYLRFTLTFLGVWWGLAFFLAFLQAYFMSGQIFFIPLSGAIGLIMFKLHRGLLKKIIQKKTWAIITLYIYAAINFIPLILQFTGVRTPGIDVIVTAFIGLSLIILVPTKT